MGRCGLVVAGLSAQPAEQSPCAEFLARHHAQLLRLRDEVRDGIRPDVPWERVEQWLAEHEERMRREGVSV